MNYDENALQAVRERRFLIDEYDAWLVEEIKPYLGQRIIEIGCGLGNLIRHFIDKELVVGIEPSADIVQKVKQTYKEYNNVSIYEYSITDPAVLSLKDIGFDSAVSLNVFEHIRDDEIAIQNTAMLLKPNGYFILIVPAHQWLYGKMDESIGHYRRYDKASTKKKLENLGFKVINQKYMNTIGALGWYVNGRLLGKTVPPSGQLRIFNKIVPLIKMLEKAITPSFGISLMSVAQRYESN